jgi:multidrug efflux pump subunit AcrA (membrane-fusion protein)
MVAVKESDPKVVKPGMTADVEFICDTVSNTIYVPLESVNERNGKTYTS